MNDTIDFTMTASVVVIAVCLLLTLVWLVLRIGNAAIVLCHSASAFARSLVVGAPPKASTSTRTDAVDGEPTQPFKQPAVNHMQHEKLWVAKGLQPSNANETGPHEGVARSHHGLGNGFADQSANGRQQQWRPLATPRTTSTSSILTSTLTPSRPSDLPAPVVPDADAAMRFRIWLLESGLEQIDRGHGELIATADLWSIAQRFARESGFRIGSHDRFFEELRKLPGVHKEENRWVTRLQGPREKRVAYSFQPAIVSKQKAVGY